MVKSRSTSHRTQAERSEATRQALLAAGRELFAIEGYARAGREAIVAAAGVTRGALQHHFGDKEGLFAAVYELTEQEVMGRVAEAAMAAGHEDPAEQLRLGCEAYLDAVLDPAVQRICAIDGPAVLPAERRDEITDRYALGLVREVVQAAVDRGQFRPAPVEPLTRVLLGAVTAAAQYVATATDPRAAREEAGTTVEVLLTSLRP